MDFPRYNWIITYSTEITLSEKSTRKPGDLLPAIKSPITLNMEREGEGIKENQYRDMTVLLVESRSKTIWPLKITMTNHLSIPTIQFQIHPSVTVELAPA